MHISYMLGHNKANLCFSSSNASRVDVIPVQCPLASLGLYEVGYYYEMHEDQQL